MKKLRLLTKIYQNKSQIFDDIKSTIMNEIKDLNVQLQSIILDNEGFITITMEGEEEEVAYNYLKELFGESKKLDELQKGDTLQGYVCSSGSVGFGIFVDIGIKDPYEVDALLPLYTLREQLFQGQKVSVKKIIDLYALIDNFPLEITIEEVSVGLKKITAKLSENQIDEFNTWIEESLEKLVIIGAYETEIREALKRSRHLQDIIALDSLGWMEAIITCKFNTTAKGLIPAIGSLLPDAHFEIFSPTKIRLIKNN
ncbi:MAG: DUF2110 family protein [Asgard group archaeon]|nr:DUF2110 family protein [Asgard group archaeon]